MAQGLGGLDALARLVAAQLAFLLLAQIDQQGVALGGGEIGRRGSDLDRMVATVVRSNPDLAATAHPVDVDVLRMTQET